ncbi:MAG: hypothetical protein ABGX84_05060 [Alcanivorax sp.]
MRLRKLKTESTLVQIVLLATIVLASLFTLWPVLTGPFLFDDYSNLDALRLLGGDITAEGLRAYTTEKSAGPTGRPLSMISFLINDLYWPSSAHSFKHTNILIHVLNGLVLTWLVLIIAKQQFVKMNLRLQVAAILVAGFWILNPYHISSVAYVVQRMTLLSTLCVLAGLVLYVKGRIYLEEGQKKKGYTIIWAGYVVGAGVGVLFKENAAIFVFLTPIFEISLFSHNKKTKKPYLLILTLAGPAFLLLLALSSYLFSLDAYTWYRDFTLTERLLSQSRAVGYYLWRYIIPGVGYVGIYTDGFDKSINLFEPISTFVWLLIHALILIGSFSLRRKLPLLFLGVWFFYAAHSIESSVIPLELFFEHRNYLPSALLILGFLHVYKYKYFIPIALVVVALSASLQYLRATFWSDEQKIASIMVIENPKSERATISYASYLERERKYAQALQVLRLYMTNNNYGFDIALNATKIACALKEDTKDDVTLLMGSLEKYRGKAKAMTDQVKDIARKIRDGRCQVLSFDDLRRFIDLYLEAYPRDKSAIQASYIARGYIEYFSGDEEALKDSILSALKVRDNASLAYSGCSQIGLISRQDACSCFKQNEHYVMGSAEDGKTLMQFFLGERDRKRKNYLARMDKVCAN